MAQPNLSREKEYPISITCRHFDLTKAIEDHVQSKISKIDHVANGVTHVAVVLDSQRIDFICSVVMHFPHHQIKVHANAPDLYQAIDACGEKLFNLVSRYKDKIHHKNRTSLAEMDMEVNVIRPFNDELKLINDDIDAENAKKEYERTHFHEIIRKENVAVKTHTQEEAIMKMEFSHSPFMIYRSEEDQKLKVIYRREDNNYNLVNIQ